MNATARDLASTEADIRARFPDVLRLGYPRRFRVPDGWPSPAPISALMADYYLNGRPAADFDDDDALRAAYMVTSTLYRNRVPTYFVGRELLPSLLATDPPEDMAAADIPWPVPTALFIFPMVH